MKILILTNYQLGLYKFRRELLERLIAEHHEVYVSVPEDEFTRELKKIGIRLIHNRYMDRRGTNPIHDLRLMNYYRSMLKGIRPDVVLTYTIKPNAYGGHLCGRMGIPYIANVTGLGTAVENGGMMQKLTLSLYKNGLKHASKVFFQNEENRSFMLKHGIVKKEKTDLLPGSGVNTKQHCYEPYPEEWTTDVPGTAENPTQNTENTTDPHDMSDTGKRRILLTTIGRIMKDKGIEEILEAAKTIRKTHPEVVFRLVGDFDEGYEDIIREYEKNGLIEYLGSTKDIHPYIAESHAILHASYHEGMSNVLQEAASTGRPVIATDIPGCIETYEPGVTGIAFKPKDTVSLIKAIEEFLSLTHEEKETMGRKGREKMVNEFDRSIVVEKYLEVIEGIK